MKTRRLVAPFALLMLASSLALLRAGAAEAPSPVPKPSVRTHAARTEAAELESVWLPGVTLEPSATDQRTGDQEAMRARLDELRARIASGDATAGDEARAMAAELRARAAAGDPGVTVTRDANGGERVSTTVTYRVLHGAMTPEERRVRIEELKARAAAGDPNVKVTTSSTRTVTMSPDEARAKIAELRARAAAGDPDVTVMTRPSTSTARPEVKMTVEERARRQAYVEAHPDLPAQTKEKLLAGYVVPAMKFEDVEQVLGPLQPVDGRLPNGELPYPDEKVYTAQLNGKTVYLYFREGKLLRR